MGDMFIVVRAEKVVTQSYQVYLVDSVVNVIEGDFKVLRTAQGCELMIG